MTHEEFYELPKFNNWRTELVKEGTRVAWFYDPYMDVGTGVVTDVIKKPNDQQVLVLEDVSNKRLSFLGSCSINDGFLRLLVNSDVVCVL